MDVSKLDMKCCRASISSRENELEAKLVHGADVVSGVVDVTKLALDRPPRTK